MKTSLFKITKNLPKYIKNTDEKDETMKRKISACSILLFLISYLFIGCTALTKHGQMERSARQHFESGRYDQAVFDCISALKIKPEYDKAQILIQEVFRTATEYHENKIKELIRSDRKFKWDEITSEYESLEKIHQHFHLSRNDKYY